MADVGVLNPGEQIKPSTTPEECEELIARTYGLKCSEISELNGYDDNNYRVFVNDLVENDYIESVSKNGYVLKIMNSLDSKKSSFVDGQTSLMLFLSE